MKRLTILAVMAALAGVMACTKEQTPNQEQGKDNTKPGGDDLVETFSLSPYSVTFEGEGGTVKVAVETSAEDYTVTGAPDWLSVAKNGKELTLTASANTEKTERTCTLTVKGKYVFAELPVTQKGGSPYQGYTVATSATLEYSGTTLYMFLKPTEEHYGGMAYLAMEDEEHNALDIWIYTELFASEEEVELTPGTYTKGEDNYPYTLCGKVLTYAPGVTFSFSDEDEEEEVNVGGSFYTDAVTGQAILLVDGTVEVTPADEAGAYLIKVDLVGSDGKTYQYVYEGQVEIDTEGAAYPSETAEHHEIVENILQTGCYYLGDQYENGTTTFELDIVYGNEESPAVASFQFFTEATEFAEDLDISGTYYTPDEEEGLVAYSPGTLLPGVLIEFEGFQFPYGTYAMYDFGDYVIGDAFSSLILEKGTDGTYTLSGVIMSADGTFVMFPEFEGISIPILDGTAEEDEED